ncbi:syntabulin isoform X2 [Latimeria chalumnae]|uniref:syntabulin isoform X2 n=1 Tax=Latimeria chalumnae TaxID=7897 RepID=UPI0006D9318D|nr:PREDICTED: syntabulin isoform X2 [Latimeria chalumnae]|eukprot:XP_014351912.1 PREDICTED: syntabulin isoform X2 [Latimeria chalumnae]
MTGPWQQRGVGSGMGPYQQHKKVQEKESLRSRIPRLVLRPFHPKQKGSPSSESPFSEEESKEYDLSSGRSRRTISSNSFCSDDTGCPSSQTVSPVKTPSETGKSPIVFPAVFEEDDNRKKLNTGAPQWNPQPVRYKKEQKPCPAQPGSEADFSSSSSTGSISAPEVHIMSASGNKKSSLSRNRGSHGRNGVSTSYKSAVSPTASREKDLLVMLSRNQSNPLNIPESYGPSSHSSSSNSGSYKGSDSSPTLRRSNRYTSCNDNHGIKPPPPEQYLTPLQQKEVTIRHMRMKLKESENRIQEREAEIVDLKSQLERMREDWIEEECHRVEAQLALKEARKEIKQLKQVIETMKNSLLEKDKGIQKYFIDINIQNKKLESLLQSMELAQNGALMDEVTFEYVCGSPGKSLGRSSTYTKMNDGTGMEDQAAEEMADSGLLANDEMANRSDLFDHIMISSALESGDVAHIKATEEQPKFFKSTTYEKIPAKADLLSLDDNTVVMEQAIQTDVISYSPDVQKLILQVLQSQSTSPVSPMYSVCVPHPLQVDFADELAGETVVDLTPGDQNSTILVAHMESIHDVIGLKATANSVMKELDFTASVGTIDSINYTVGSQTTAVVERRYWSSSFIVDLLAIMLPVVPTVAWVFATQRGGIDPIYNIGALLRGCCMLALHSLRRAPCCMHFGSNVQAKKKPH